MVLGGKLHSKVSENIGYWVHRGLGRKASAECIASLGSWVSSVLCFSYFWTKEDGRPIFPGVVFMDFD